MAENIKHTKFNIYDFFNANTARKTYGNIAVSLLLIIILVFFALMPTITTIDKIKEKIKTYQNLNSKLITKIKAAQILNEQQNIDSSKSEKGAKQEILYLNKIFFNQLNLVDFYNNLQIRAKESNIAIINFTPKYQSTASAKSFEKSDLSPSSTIFEVSFDFEGKTLSEVESFIQKLESIENFPILSRIRSINLQDNSNITKSDSNNEIVQGNLSMFIYLDETRIEQ